MYQVSFNLIHVDVLSGIILALVILRALLAGSMRKGLR